MIDKALLSRATGIGILLQLALAIAAIVSPWVAAHLLMFGRIVIAAAAGFLYGQALARGYSMGALGGTLAGGLSALPGVLLSAFAGNVPAAVVATGTGASILAGGAGGVFGHIAATMRKLGM